MSSKRRRRTLTSNRGDHQTQSPSSDCDGDTVQTVTRRPPDATTTVTVTATTRQQPGNVHKYRGIASFSKKIPDSKLHIEFDNNNKPCGESVSLFRSYYSTMVRHNFDYWIPMNQFSNDDFKELWLHTKAYWKIKTDAPEAYMRKYAIRIGTNFRSDLVQHYVRKNLNACHKYPFMKPHKWDDFVRQKTCKEFLAKSTQAKAANAANENKLRLGRSGWSGVEQKLPIIWPQLLERHEDLKSVTNFRSKLLIVAMAKKNKETQLYELDNHAVKVAANLNEAERNMKADKSYYENKEDPIIRVLGPEHGGRSRTVSDIIGYTKVHGGLVRNVNDDRDSTPSLRDSNCRSNGHVDYPPIEVIFTYISRTSMAKHIHSICFEENRSICSSTKSCAT
ncbi:hypothetical protein SSX86_025199 [Deinandra increscens subsp. villosa]|uniref:Uncharacterized protein n=1 Tax=Deinandra increscens subsp. villosa TaxID=3103831 RepID=A0AAP0CH86_9ASTR